MRSLTGKEVSTYLEVLDLREKLIAPLAIFEGFRPGEILALRWKTLNGDQFRVEERVYKGVLDTPKNGKAREGAMTDGTLSLMRDWTELAEDRSPDGFVSLSEKLTTPLSLGNLWRRSMEPKLKKVGLDWATFQALRKTNASLSKKAGTDPKVSADQRDHGLGVSMDHYTSPDLEEKRETVKELEAEVTRQTEEAAQCRATPA
jgi:integrase